MWREVRGGELNVSPRRPIRHSHKRRNQLLNRLLLPDVQPRQQAPLTSRRRRHHRFGQGDGAQKGAEEGRAQSELVAHVRYDAVVCELDVYSSALPSWLQAASTTSRLFPVLCAPSLDQRTVNCNINVATLRVIEQSAGAVPS